jgi:hypothetical protein
VLRSAAINEPRFDYDPATLVAQGLLIEDQRTNLLLQSEDFSTTWAITGTASISTNVASSPAGTATADKFILGNTITSGNAALFQSVAKAATATTYTVSLFVKAAEFNSLRLIFRNTAAAGSNVEAYFNAATGTIAFGPTANGTFTSASATISAVGNSWYRVTLTGTTSTETSVNIRMLVYQNGTGTATGNGSDGILIWGAQLEVGPFPTSYIPTVDSQVTRSVDAASMTGTNFSSWYNQDEGTLYTEASGLGNFRLNTWANGSIVALSPFDGGINNFIAIQIEAPNSSSVNGDSRFEVSQSGISYAALSTNYNGGINKFAGAYKVNDIAFVNSQTTAVQTDTSALIPTCTALSIGQFTSNGSRPLNGHIRSIAYYNTRLSNTVLQGVTR